MRIRLSVVALLLGFLLLGSCATAPVAQRESRIMSLVDRINGDSLVRVVEVTAVPFVLDGEIIELPADIETMWSNLQEAGFSLPDARIEEITPVRGDSHRRFADTMDLRVFFEKYIPEDATFVRIESENGAFLFVLGDRFWGVPRMYAMKGPLR
ncbi:MAG: hypothetical protein ACLFUM_10645 [Spirochaetaceae bacterium]